MVFLERSIGKFIISQTTAQWFKLNREMLKLFPYLRRKAELRNFLLPRQVSEKGFLCRSPHETCWHGGLGARGKALFSCSIFLSCWFETYNYRKHLLSFSFLINKLRFLGKIFLVKKRCDYKSEKTVRGAQLFEGRIALKPGLNLTLVSISCVQKHCLG